MTFPLGGAPYTYDCVGTKILGGFGILDTTTVMERTFPVVPTHDIIYLKMSFWILDAWTASVEGIRIAIDGSYHTLWTDLGDSASWTGPICGDTTNDMGEVVV